MSTVSHSFSTDATDQTIASLAELPWRAAQQSPTSGMYFLSGAGTHEATFLSYPMLLEEAGRILSGLRASAHGRERHVVLLLESPRDLIPAFWGCVLGGYVPCPVVPTRDDQERLVNHVTYIDGLLDHPLIIGDEELVRELPTTVASAVLNDLRCGVQATRFDKFGPTDTAAFFLTSGSTGNSKAVALTHDNILSSMAGKAEIRQLSAADVMLNWVSFDHVAALLEAHVLPLYLGARQLHASPGDILAESTLFLRIIDAFRVSTSFTPNFLLGQMIATLNSARDGGKVQFPKLDLSCVRHIFSGGEANPVETGRQFLELLAPYGLRRGTLWPAYGMTETCAAAVYSREFPDLDEDCEFASVGVPMKGFEMRIVDDHGSAVSAGEPGHLQVRGPMVFSRYHNNEEATRASFAPDGWFDTGDLGRIDSGRLRLVGRSKDSIIVSGVNYVSHQLEMELERLDGIERSFVAAFPTRPKGTDTEQLAVAFSTAFPLSDETRLYRLVVAVRNTTVMLWGFRPGVILPLPNTQFPKTNLGKIQRSLMRKRLEAGEFASALAYVDSVRARQGGTYTPPAGEVECQIVEILAQMFGLRAETLSATANFFDLGGTSLDILKLTRIIDRRLGLDATLTTVLKYPTARQLAGVIIHGSGSQGSAYDPIVPLQVTGQGTPLFCVHPGDGGTLVFVNLAQYFVNERPLYALRPRGFDHGEECFGTFEEMVSTYLHAIVERQPYGPYAIAGYSLGGCVAFEIAKRLEAGGARVCFLGCIDGMPDEETNVDFAGALLGAAQLLEHVDTKHFTTWSKVATALHAVTRAHVMSGTVKSMSVFASGGLPPNVGRSEWLTRIRRWDNFVTRPKYIEVAGDHHTLLSPKHVAGFQAILHSELEEAYGNA